MAIGTVSTYTQFQSTLSDVSTVESNLTQEQEQLSSGNAAQNFAGMSSQSQQYLSLSDTISRTAQYLTNHQVIEAGVNTASSALGQIVTIVNNLQSLISQRATGTSNNADFAPLLHSTWQQLVGQLNTNVNNQYIFSGTATSTPAVNSTTFPTLKQSGVPDAGYYQGSAQNMTTRIDDNSVISYGVRADAQPFQQIFAGLVMAQQGDQNNSSSDFESAESLLSQGIQGVISLQATVNATAVQLTTSDTSLNNQKLYLQGLQQTIGNTDIVSVSTQVAVNQGLLQAAFEAFSKITSLQLSNYLK